MREWIGSYVSGIVTVKLSGGNKERFINLCKGSGIYLWNIRYCEHCTFNVGIDDFFRFAPIVRKAGGHIHIIKKTGLPFFLYRYRKRKAFAAGIFAGFLIVYLLSLYIWDLQVEGNYSHSEYEILSFLKERQIVWGMKKQLVDCDQIEKDIRNQYFDITWVSVEVSGTRLVVHLKENEEVLVETEATEPQTQGIAYHLVANKDCVITRVVMRKGTPAVKKTMEVKNGDVLVYGFYDVLNDAKEVVRTQYLSADADVYGKVVYTYQDSLPLRYIRKEYKEKKDNYSVRVGNRMVHLFSKDSDLEQADEIREEKQLALYGNFYLPLYLMKTTTKTYEEKECFYSENQAIDICEEKFSYFIKNLEKNTIQIIENNVTIEVRGETCVCSGTIVVEEKIGTLMPATMEREG